MTHLLRVDENPASMMGAAGQIGKTVEDAVIEEAVKWIHSILVAKHSISLFR